MSLSDGVISQDIPMGADVEIGDSRDVPEDLQDLEVVASGLFPQTIEGYNILARALGVYFNYEPKVWTHGLYCTLLAVLLNDLLASFMLRCTCSCAHSPVYFPFATL